MSEIEIANRLDGDHDGLNIWIRFLYDLGWIDRNQEYNRWALSDVGKIELAEQKITTSA